MFLIISVAGNCDITISNDNPFALSQAPSLMFMTGIIIHFETVCLYVVPQEDFVVSNGLS